MLMNDLLVKVYVCRRKLAWLPPESRIVPFCRVETVKRDQQKFLEKKQRVLTYCDISSTLAFVV